MTWKLSEAKNRLSEVLDRVRQEGPQTISRRDESYVVIAQAKYDELVGTRPSFKDWLLNGPRSDELELPPRHLSPMRKVEL